MTVKRVGRWHVLSTGVLLALALWACQTSAPTAVPRVAVAVGANTAAEPLLRAWQAAYQRHASDVTLAPEYGDGYTILDGLRTGRFAGAVLSSPVPPVDVWSQPVALDGLALIVHPDNPISGLSVAEVRALFQGQSATWPAEAGGEPLVVEIVTREEGSATRAWFERTVMGEQKVTLTALIVPDSRAVVDYVATHPGALGYVSLGWVDARVRALALDGVVPSPESVRTQEYGLVTPIYFVSLAEPQGDLRQFYLYMLSPDGQEVVAGLYGRVR